MTDNDFRNLLTTVFDNVPTYHLKSIAKSIKKNNKKSSLENLWEKVRD